VKSPTVAVHALFVENSADAGCVASRSHETWSNHRYAACPPTTPTTQRRFGVFGAVGGFFRRASSARSEDRSGGRHESTEVTACPQTTPTTQKRFGVFGAVGGWFRRVARYWRVIVTNCSSPLNGMVKLAEPW
jgi:hypothetical protein